MQSTGSGHSRYPPVLATALDTLVRVLVKRCEVFPELLIFLGDPVAWADVAELLCEVPQRRCVKLVLVRLLLVSRSRPSDATTTHFQIA